MADPVDVLGNHLMNKLHKAPDGHYKCFSGNYRHWNYRGSVMDAIRHGRPDYAINRLTWWAGNMSLCNFARYSIVFTEAKKRINSYDWSQ